MKLKRQKKALKQVKWTKHKQSLPIIFNYLFVYRYEVAVAPQFLSFDQIIRQQLNPTTENVQITNSKYIPN